MNECENRIDQSTTNVQLIAYVIYQQKPFTFIKDVQSLESKKENALRPRVEQ